jgi:hypothetical protein
MYCLCVNVYCTVLLPPGDNPIAVNKYIISYILSHHIIIREILMVNEALWLWSSGWLQVCQNIRTHLQYYTILQAILTYFSALLMFHVEYHVVYYCLCPLRYADSIILSWIGSWVDSRGGITELVKGKKSLPQPEIKNNPVTRLIPSHCSDRDNK